MIKQAAYRQLLEDGEYSVSPAGCSVSTDFASSLDPEPCAALLSYAENL